MRINLTPPQLAAFLHIARTGSFSEAAALQGVSQPALSRTIRMMEEAIGRRLFDRTTRNVALTPAGRELRPIAERMVAEFDSAFGELAQFIEGRRGRIVVAGLPSICAELLPGAIVRFKATHPAVDFLIHDGLSGTVAGVITEGRADIGLTVRPPSSEKLAYRPLLMDEFGLVCRPDDALAERQSVPWSVFETRPFIAMNPASSVRAMTDAAFLHGGVAIKPLYECAFLGTAGNLVAAGLGITALPRLTLRLVSAADLVWRPLVLPSLQRSLGIVTQLGRSLSPAAQQFVAALLAEAGRYRPV